MSTRKDVEAIVESHEMLGRGTYNEWSYLIDALATYVDRRVQLATRESVDSERTAVLRPELLDALAVEKEKVKHFIAQCGESMSMLRQLETQVDEEIAKLDRPLPSSTRCPLPEPYPWDPWLLLDHAWCIIANANDGNWDEADFEWRKAAEQWRDRYFSAISARKIQLGGQQRPTIVCLCGSTRFGDAFAKANLDETLAGKIVLTVGCMTHSDTQLGLDECSCLGGADEDPAGRCENCKTKAAFDELHKRKIDLCDEILVLNAMACARCGRTVGLPGRPYDGPAGIQAGYACESLQHDWCNWQPYVGDSTKSEIAYAMKLGKRVRWLHEPKEEP